MYKKALHSFFLKVHPDFFGAHPQQQRTNEASIAALNELLDWAKAFKAGRYAAPPTREMSVDFFRKPENGEVVVQQVQARFELPKNFAAVESSKGTAERAVNRFLRELLRKAKCLDESEVHVSQAQDETQRREERATNRPNSKRKQVRTLMDEAAESIESEWSPTRQAPTMDELIENDQIIFDSELSPVQCGKALATLQANLEKLSYDRWHHVPIVISKAFKVDGDIPGSITIPWDFDVMRFRHFLNASGDRIHEARQAVMDLAKKVEGLITNICAQLNADDVLLTNVTNRRAVATLEKVLEFAPMFIQHDVTGVTIEIADADKCAHRANGVVIVKAGVTDDELTKFLRTMKPRMAALRQVYADAKNMIDSTLWHLKKFREMVKPAAIDPFSDNQSYYHRLVWAKEMTVLAPMIVKWDWSEFSFGLGPLEIDWDNKTILLPYNFDAASFMRYVEEIHEGVKREEREKLAKDEVDRLMLETKRSAQEIQGMTKMSGEVPPVPSTSAAKQEYAPDGTPQSTPSYDQYMTSSPTGNDHLEVERPLSHQVHFQSEEEAADQLEWEGFYRGGYETMVPDSDIDDVCINFLHTNRWQREAAVKKMMEEMEGKYGRSREFRSKLGDKLGLNDPTELPKGFPIHNKGTFTGYGRPTE